MLNKADKSRYTLLISEGKQVKSNCKPSQTANVINIVLKNNSNDTLKYIDWTCSSMIWKIDNHDFILEPPFEFQDCGTCDKNIVSVFEVLPHKTIALKVYVRKKNIDYNKAEFKIGMILQRIIYNKDFWVYAHYFMEGNNQLSYQTTNLIWSNSIEIH